MLSWYWISNRKRVIRLADFVGPKTWWIAPCRFRDCSTAGECSQALATQIEARRSKIDAQLDALEQTLRQDLNVDAQSSYVTDVQGQPASGCISASGASANCNIQYKKEQIKDVKTVQVEPVKTPTILDLEQELQRSGRTNLQFWI